MHAHFWWAEVRHVCIRTCVRTHTCLSSNLSSNISFFPENDDIAFQQNSQPFFTETECETDWMKPCSNSNAKGKYYDRQWQIYIMRNCYPSSPVTKMLLNSLFLRKKWRIFIFLFMLLGLAWYHFRIKWIQGIHFQYKKGMFPSKKYNNLNEKVQNIASI